MTTTLAAVLGGPLIKGSFDPVPKLGSAFVTLEELVVHSIYSWARASDDDPLPVPGDSRRGWWGDSTREDGDTFGSRLWLLERAVATQARVAMAEDYIRDALGWLVADRIAARVDVVVQPLKNGRLGAAVTVWRDVATAPVELQFPDLWESLRNG